MKLTKEQKANEAVVPTVDVELNEEQLEAVAGGTFPWLLVTNFPIILTTQGGDRALQ